jgi:hypothetical protein
MPVERRSKALQEICIDPIDCHDSPPQSTFMPEEVTTFCQRVISACM